MKPNTRINRRSGKSSRSMLPPPPRRQRRKERQGTSGAPEPKSAPQLEFKVEPEVPAPAQGTVHLVTEPPVPAGHLAGRDAYELYLREIGQTALLRPEEELSLARRVKAGDAEAREHMIKANLRLVVKIAREYEGFGVPLLDMISEGNMGLIKGVERFDPDKGAKLSTYAAWWIKQNIRRALANQSKTIRLPAHVVEKRVQIRAVETRLTELLGRAPNDAEIAEELGLEAGWVRHYRQALVSPSSLDAPLNGDDESNRLADVVADPSATTPYDEARSQADNALVNEVLDTLNQREREILQLRFGLGGDEERTLEEIGDKFGLTRERIRQIQERALHKMRVRIEERETPVLSP